MLIYQTIKYNSDINRNTKMLRTLLQIIRLKTTEQNNNYSDTKKHVFMVALSISSFRWRHHSCCSWQWEDRPNVCFSFVSHYSWVSGLFAHHHFCSIWPMITALQIYSAILCCTGQYAVVFFYSSSLSCVSSIGITELHISVMKDLPFAIVCVCAFFSLLCAGIHSSLLFSK